MALYITEFSAATVDTYRMLPAATLPSGTTQSVAVAGSSAQSAILDMNTRLIRLVSDERCKVEVGASPTASGTSMPLQSGVAEYFNVPANSGFKIAAIAY